MDDVIFPKPMSPEDIARKKKIDKLEARYAEQASKIEFILNAAFSEKGDILL